MIKSFLLHVQVTVMATHALHHMLHCWMHSSCKCAAFSHLLYLANRVLPSLLPAMNVMQHKQLEGGKQL
jgi:hypothetical protein